MARDGTTIFSDIAGKLELLRVECEKCGRRRSRRIASVGKRRISDTPAVPSAVTCRRCWGGVNDSRVGLRGG
jgi:hypothetical protein